MAETAIKGYYEIGGELYPRVTSILNIIEKQGLGRWRGNVGNKEADRIAKEAAQLGTDFHELCADINRGAHRVRGWQPEGRFREMAFAYIDWLHANVEQIIDVEKLAISDEFKYAGTMDLLAIMRGDDLPSVIDLKTSNSVSTDWPLQLSAYQLAIEEELGVNIGKRIIIRIPKKGICIPEQYTYTEHEDDKDAWLTTLKLWRWIQKDKKRQKTAFNYQIE